MVVGVGETSGEVERKEDKEEAEGEGDIFECFFSSDVMRRWRAMESCNVPSLWETKEWSWYPTTNCSGTGSGEETDKIFCLANISMAGRISSISKS